MENNEIINQISNHFHLDNIIAKIICSRGIDSIEKAEKFLNPDIKDLTPLSDYFHVDEITKRIENAIKNDETIVLYGDYDCDGICGVSILYLYLKSRDCNVHYFLPNRHTDGYGLSNETLERIAETLYPDLLITVDCGITNWDEVDYAQEVLGIEVIVTDHHETLDTLPNCLIFNTKLCKSSGFKGLCGAGVALRLVESLGGLQESKKYYDIAALATVADIVPLIDDNRIIVSNGLKLINLGYRKGIKLLVDKCVKKRVMSSDIGFRIAPRINSVGRIGDANKVVNLFTVDDTVYLTNLINEIEEANETRQRLTNDLVIDCMDKVIGYDFSNMPIIVLYNKYWDDGVLGIASAKLVSEFNRPVILLTKSGNYLKGSGRSVEGINILECVKSVEDLLYKYGGHAMACGLSLKEEYIDEFIKQINENCKRLFGEIKLERKNKAFCKLSNLTLDFAKQLSYLEPYGEANREIEFYDEISKCDFVQLGASEHLKYRNKGVDYISYFSLDKLELLNSDTLKRINFNVNINEFRNVQTPQIIIQNVIAEKITGNLSLQNYLYQGIFKDEALGSVNELSINDAIALSNESKYGIAYLCYDFDTYKNLDDSFKNNLIINNSFVDSLCPNNRLIFNPKPDINLTYYDKIVFLEKPISLGFLDNIKINKDTKIYYVNNDSMIKKCANKLVSYQDLGKIFISVKHILETKVFTDIRMLFNQINISNIDFDNYCVAMHIFMNLGIVKFNKNGIIIDRNIRTSLDSSELYLKLKNKYGD